MPLSSVKNERKVFVSNDPRIPFSLSDLVSMTPYFLSEFGFIPQWAIEENNRCYETMQA